MEQTSKQLSHLSALLAESGVIVLDGAQGTELERRGVHLGGSKLWSAQLLVDDPDLVRAIHLDYLRAGADVITTFTYQASIQGYADTGVDAATAAILLNRAVDLAESARATFLREQEQKQKQQTQSCSQQKQPLEPGSSEWQHAQQAYGAADLISAMVARDTVPRLRPLIAFSSGSYGAYLADGSEFSGNYAASMSLQQLVDFHRARLEPVRHRTEIDLLAFETVPCLREAEAIVELLRQEQYGKPAWISFSCRDAVHTCHGERFGEQCVPLLAAAAAEGLVAAVGVNCTAPRHVGPLLTAARERLHARRRPAVVTACSGTSPSALPPQQALQAPAQPPIKEAQPQSGPLAQRQTADQLQHQKYKQGEQLQQQQQNEPAPQLLLLCYPNSGEEWDGEHHCWRHLPDDIAEPGRFAEAAAEWVYGATGLALVGGCCRTGPEHIRALRRRLLQEQQRRSQQQQQMAGGVGDGGGRSDGAGGG